MRAYYVDEITAEDAERVVKHLKEKGVDSLVDGAFFIGIPDDLLNEEQKSHLAECGPYVAVLEAEKKYLKLELLVRARGKLRCSCVLPADVPQRNYLVGYLDGLLGELKILT